MESTLYFKELQNSDQNNYPTRIYRVEHQKMLIEILDKTHVQGAAKYFSSVRSRNDYMNTLKDHITQINMNELKEIQKYWKSLH